MKEKVDDNVVMDCNGVISEIKVSVFFEILGGNLESIIDKNKDSHE